MWDEVKQQRLIDKGISAADEITQLFDDSVTARDAYGYGMCTWKTGTEEKRLASDITSIEHILGQPNPEPKWMDTIDEPLHPNAKTPEECFDHDFSSEQLDAAHDIVEGKVEEFAKTVTGSAISSLMIRTTCTRGFENPRKFFIVMASDTKVAGAGEIIIFVDTWE